MPSSSTKPRIDSVLSYLNRCPERYMVTLTTKRRYDSLGLTKLVDEWQHRLNRQLFGTSYSRHKRVRLATYAVQELNYNQGIHTHLLVGIPEATSDLKPNRSALSFEIQAIQAWCALDHGGRPAGQDVRPITDFMGAYHYIHKTVRDLGGVDNIDVMNMHIPSVEPTVPTLAAG